MRLVVLSAAATFVIDQITKFVVVQMLDLYGRQEILVLPPWITFRMAWNEGINFGLMANSSDIARLALIALAIAISVWVWAWVKREPHSATVHISAGLLIGGAMGNVLDRIIYGAVADFLNMSVPGISNPYSFNVADIAIFAGAIGLVFFTGREKTT
ncbi:MAG TPA: signal peptidase II [Albidovulum sp.]|uniref:signal peptidase II n=1 Tax=Albidovulum sp. TaxID=1872424 RepID=UPI002C18A951|nr:signal peptidase II [Albidovulum sp.]